MPLSESARRLLEPKHSRSGCDHVRPRDWSRRPIANSQFRVDVHTRSARLVPPSRRTAGARSTCQVFGRTRAVASRVTLGGGAHPAGRAPQLALPTRALGPQSGTQPPRPARACCCSMRFQSEKKMQQLQPERGTGERLGEPDPKPGTKQAKRSAVRSSHHRSRPVLAAMSA